MDSSRTESKKYSITQGKNVIKNDYLQLIKQYRKKNENKKKLEFNLHKSIKMLQENNIFSNEKNEDNNLKNITKKVSEKILTPPQEEKKHILKTSPKKKPSAKIIYKNTINTPNLYNEKKKESLSVNIEFDGSFQKNNLNNNQNNNNDKDTLTTSTTSPITTPVKDKKEDNLNNIFFSGDNNKRAFYHYQRNYKKYISPFNININNINDSNIINNTIGNLNNFNTDFNNDYTLDDIDLNNTIQIPKKNLDFLSEQMIFNKKLINKNQDSTEKKFLNKTISNLNQNMKNINKCDLCLNIEDLIMIEDKFTKLIKTLNDKNINFISKTCYEWWNFYFNCSLKGNCDYLFMEPRNKNVIACHNSLLLISIMIIYDLSFSKNTFLKLSEFIKKILYLNHQNYLNICQYLISRIKPEFLSSKWVEQLIEITSSQVTKKKLYIYELDQNLQSLNKLLSILISNLNTSHQILNPKIEEIYKNFIRYDSNTINKIFMSNILQIDNKGGSLLFSLKKFNNPIINDFFIKKKPLKQITLVLDLDETLMSFVYTSNNKKEGISRLRPFLYNFLNLVKEYYEIITFTAATQRYADPILDAIEIKKGKYFNYRLYRNHCSIVNNSFVKDISLIGRDLKKMIIVDNMQQNFKLQKENGILISSFWGEDSNDKALLQLGRILVTIATDMIDNNYNTDIRDLITKYKDDILKNVSMN